MTPCFARPFNNLSWRHGGVTSGWRCYRVTATLGNLLQGRHGDSWLVTPCHALVTWLSHGSAKVPKFNVNFTDLLLPLRHRTRLLRISPRPLKRGDTPRPHCGSHTSPLVTPQLITAAETLCNVPSPVIYLDTRGDSDTLPCNCCLQTLARYLRVFYHLNYSVLSLSFLFTCVVSGELPI